jgi:3-deoxy-D-manno-octulosonic-acid transferase
MESKESNDIFNLAADTIIKWYEQTHTAMTNAVKPASPQVDAELMGILLAAKKQTLGALTTLANKHILSVHALLRILTEIHIVLIWVLNVPEKEKKAKYVEVNKRLRRWDHTRLKKDKALFEDLPQTAEMESVIGQIEKDIEKLRKEGIKELPNCKQLYSDLGKEPEEVKELGEAYAIFYRRYSRAVHLNRNVTQELAWIQYENEKPKAIFYKDDIKPDGNELITIASISSDINKAIRDFYGWQSDAMQNEYEQLKSKLVKK